MMKTTTSKTLIFLIFACLFLTNYVQAQINAYAKVTGISGSTLTLSNVDETNHSFTVGEQIIIMQIQDDVIGSNIADNSNFGDLGSILSAGLYETGVINTINESGGIPTSIVLNASPVNSYNTGTNSSVQIVSFQSLGTPDYTTSANINLPSWDGNTGGVVAINVPGTLTLLHDITADGDGFRGGGVSNDVWAACVGSVYRTISVTYALKGEGIYKPTNTAYFRAKGKILNGGGGGNSHNGGGGGGGNYAAGGEGGPGWDGSSDGCPDTDDAGGLGGITLQSYINAGRIFFGGGGGGGQQNNTVGSNGGNGGGIIIIKANTLQTTTSCSGVIISADGEDTSDGGNDGTGGGGAGGTIILQVNNFNISNSCQLLISANGGDAGDVGSAEAHGAGGGGGQGSVIFSAIQPTSNVVVQTDNGQGGCNDSGCFSTGEDAPGADDIGIIDGQVTPLPIELLYFRADLKEKKVTLSWATASETNNNYFSVEKSPNGQYWESIGTSKGAGNSHTVLKYEYIDENPISGISYYRLKQTDFDGSYSYSDLVLINMSNNEATELYVFPNPAQKTVNILLPKYTTATRVGILDQYGHSFEKSYVREENKITIDISDLNPGIYYLQVIDAGSKKTRKLIVY